MTSFVPFLFTGFLQQLLMVPLFLVRQRLMGRAFSTLSHIFPQLSVSPNCLNSLYASFISLFLSYIIVYLNTYTSHSPPTHILSLSFIYVFYLEITSLSERLLLSVALISQSHLFLRLLQRLEKKDGYIHQIWS